VIVRAECKTKGAGARVWNGFGSATEGLGQSGDRIASYTLLPPVDVCDDDGRNGARDREMGDS
jgi:hypothetical protein